MIVNHPRGASKAPPAETKQHHSERIEVQPDNVPDALSRRPQWVLWRLLKRNGERTKMPFGIDGKPAKANDPATWSGYWPVVKRFQVGGFAGIGYEFSADDPFVGVDLDGCRNPETCEIADWAKEIITGLDTYAEVSPSRTGVKLFLRGKSPLSSGKKKLLSDVPKVSGKTPAIEMYDHGRYFTVTGHRLPGPREPQERQAQLDALVKRFWPSVDAQNGQHRAESSQYRTAVPIIRRARKYVATMEPAISGHDGHGCAYAVACALCIGFNLTREDALSLMREYNERCVPPWSERELEHKVDDALAADDERGHLLVNDRSHKQNGHVTTQHHIGGRNGKVAGVLTSDGRTDVSNAKRLIEVHGADLRWCDDWGCWLVWTAGRWAADQQRVIDAKAKDVAGRHWEYLSEFSRDLEPAERAALVKFATASSSARGIRNMVALARSEPGVAVMPEHLDCRSWLLNTLDGTVDLRTGIPQAHSRANLLTKQCSVGFDASATCPTWEGFLATIMAGNSELIQFLQRSLGYSLTGDTSEQVLFFLHGGGSNGKTTLLSTVQWLLGDYACTMPYGLLLAKKHDAHPCELADLHGRRLAVSVEVDDGRRLAESLVKTLTGSDTIAARRMRENFWQFAPSHKIWLAANHRPRVHGTDLAMWRRMRLIPFAVTIPAEQQDKRLPEKLRAEGPGILAWLVRGCLDWQRHGLGEPEAVKAATAEYRNEQDVIGSFLAEMTFEASTGRLKASKLHAAYVAWCKRTGEHAVNQTRFGRALTERGLEKVTSNGVWYHGIGISEGLEGSEAFWVLAPTRACRELIGEIT